MGVGVCVWVGGCGYVCMRKCMQRQERERGDSHSKIVS